MQLVNPLEQQNAVKTLYSEFVSPRSLSWAFCSAAAGCSGSRRIRLLGLALPYTSLLAFAVSIKIKLWCLL